MNEVLILGLIILVGFVGRVVFKYTKIPESLFMILIGLAVGPVFGIVDQALFTDYQSLIVTITLVIVLLDSGLKLNLFDTMKSMVKALSFTLLVLIFSTFIVGTFFILIGWDPLSALLIGVVSSGTTTIITASLLPRLKVPEDIKQILIMESIINDVTLITAAVILVQVIDVGFIDLGQLISLFVGPIVIAVVLGLVFTLLWVSVLWKFYQRVELAYVFTMGVLFILYSLVEIFGGNGAIAVLVLTLTLGNLPLILETFLGEESPLKLDFLKRYSLDLKTLQRFDDILDGIKESQVDFAFFVQNFFFVYLGVIFNPAKIDLALIGVCIAIILLMFVSRYVSARIMALSDPEFKKHSKFVASLIARGFTATFVALLPESKGIKVPLFKEIVLIMVLFSTVATILGSIIYERRMKTKPRNEPN
ncbi:MAG: cation:proton antiporter [Candidatus Bathyarchaeia archaeon]